MQRRKFLGTALMASSVKVLGSNLSTSSKQERPNILFIWTDQQTASAMSCTGNQWVKTPAMDALAAEGVLFERAYCCDPICVPSRASWITGRMPHETNITHNCSEGDLEMKGTPLSKALRDSGYDTGYVGKWHIPHDTADTEWHGFDFIRHARGNKLDPDVLPACNEFLRQKRDKPFFLTASFVNPHDICEWARIASGINTPLPNGALPDPPPPEECPPLPDNFEIPKGEPEVIRQLQPLAPGTYPTIDWEEDKWRQYLWAFYRLTERVDAQVGAILQTLREVGADDNTLIVFSTDHGDGLASHRWNQKTLFYEESARVPFIVRPPKREKTAGSQSKALVNMNLDFFATAYDYAGVPFPAELEGCSLRPVLEGKSELSAHSFVISQNDLAPTYGVSGGVYGRMLRTDRYKYVCYSSGANREQLFDLEKDPGEMNDLAESTRHQPQLNHHRRLLWKWMEERKDPFAQYAVKAS
jgi:choline-sulfatase